jgi:hypothetical protein
MSNETLRLQAREAIQNGRIPNRHPHRMWRRSGIGDHCAICNGSVGELGIDLEFFREDGGGKFPVHIDCFGAWESECQDG